MNDNDEPTLGGIENVYDGCANNGLSKTVVYTAII